MRVMTLVTIFLVSLVPLMSAIGSEDRSSSNRDTSRPQTAADWYNTGFAASKATNYKAAIPSFERAIALKSDYAEAYNMLGFCNRKLGQLTEAFRYYERALQLRPNFAEAREYYGEAFLQANNLGKAVQQYIVLQKNKQPQAAELLEEIEHYIQRTQK